MLLSSTSCNVSFPLLLTEEHVALEKAVLSVMSKSWNVIELLPSVRVQALPSRS